MNGQLASPNHQTAAVGTGGLVTCVEDMATFLYRVFTDDWYTDKELGVIFKEDKVTFKNDLPGFSEYVGYDKVMKQGIFLLANKSKVDWYKTVDALRSEAFQMNDQTEGVGVIKLLSHLPINETIQALLKACQTKDAKIVGATPLGPLGYVIFVHSPKSVEELVQMNPQLMTVFPLKILISKDMKGHVWVELTDLSSLDSVRLYPECKAIWQHIKNPLLATIKEAIEP